MEAPSSSSFDRLAKVGVRLCNLLDRASKLDPGAAKRLRPTPADTSASSSSSVSTALPPPPPPPPAPVQAQTTTTPTTTPTTEAVRLCIKTGAEETTFRILASTKFSKLFTTYATRKNVQWADYEFVSQCDGVELLPDGCAKDHDFKDMHMVLCRKRTSAPKEEKEKESGV